MAATTTTVTSTPFTDIGVINEVAGTPCTPGWSPPPGPGPGPSPVTEPYLAYSVRLLDSEFGISYSGPSMRVRRNSDGVEADVEFDSGVISLNSTISNTSATETTFGDFVGHGGTPTDAIVTVWYNQTSTGVDLYDRTVTQAFQIYDASTGLSELNGKPAFDGSYQNLAIFRSASPVTLTTETGIYVVADNLSSSNSDYIINTASSGIEGLRANSFVPTEAGGGSGLFNPSGQWAISAHLESGVASVYYDNSLVNSWTPTGTKITGLETLNIGGYGSQGYFSPWDGKIQEFIFYNSASLTGRDTITLNQKTYYGIS